MIAHSGWQKLWRSTLRRPVTSRSRISTSPTPTVSWNRSVHWRTSNSGRIGITQKVLVGMRGSYGGVLMFGLITTMMGMALVNPISIGAGVLLGTKAYREDKQAQVLKRRAEAKAAIRRFADDVSFQVGKESKDRLRLVQRLLRDHFTDIAEQALRSINESLRATQEAAQLESSEHAARIKRLETDMRVVAELDAVAGTLIGETPAPASAKVTNA